MRTSDGFVNTLSASDHGRSGLSTGMPGLLCASSKGTTMAQSIMIVAINRPIGLVFAVVANADTAPYRQAGGTDGRRATVKVSGVHPSASLVPWPARLLGRRSAWPIASDPWRVRPWSGDKCPRTLAAMRRWLRRLFGLLSLPARPAVNGREAEWLTRSAVPTEADEAARLRDEESRTPPGSLTLPLARIMLRSYQRRIDGVVQTEGGSDAMSTTATLQVGQTRAGSTDLRLGETRAG